MMVRLVVGTLTLAAALVAAAVAVAAGGAATGLTATAKCVGTPPKPVVHMRWTPSGAGRQRVQVTVFSDGFSTGRFERSARFSSKRKRLTWHDAHGEAVHHWRVVTRVDGRWVPSRTATFEGPGCVGSDQQPH